mmetsp:Transcript_8561/g.21087  ORF Transcript_8561/g.21087 Transcript_8561/m.21087 type:complete len:103 (+) Transcript_8561:998-1306(+)
MPSNESIVSGPPTPRLRWDRVCLLGLAVCSGLEEERRLRPPPAPFMPLGVTLRTALVGDESREAGEGLRRVLERVRTMVADEVPPALPISTRLPPSTYGHEV